MNHKALKRGRLILAACLWVFLLPGCAGAENNGNAQGASPKNEAEPYPYSAPVTSAEPTPGILPAGEESEDSMTNIQVIAGGETFSAVLYHNEAAEAFAQNLPLTLDMSEMNGNEKYHYLSSPLPADPSSPGAVHVGDLMLYGSDCVVLFYESFQTSYSYTPLGRVENPAGLGSALGSGGVAVTFQAG